MRKIRTAAALFLVFCMCLALSACGSSMDHAGSGNWLDDARFSGSVSEEELSTWINDLK